MAKKSIDLSAPVDIGQMVARRIAEAFKYGIECDIIHGEMLVGGSEQGIYEASDTQNYVLGTRRMTPDGRAFRYARCGATLTRMNSGLKNHSQLVTQKTGAGEGAAATAKGLKNVVITFNSNFWDTKLAVDELRGGYISFYRSTDRQQRMIVGNTAIAAAGNDDITITLKDALTVALEANDPVEILPNPYYDIRWENELWSSVMGMPTVMATVGQFFWIQTWGPIRITPVGAELGTGQDERLFVFAANGGLRSVDAMDGLDNSEQIAGFVIERTNNGAGSAAPFIMLQISP